MRLGHEIMVAAPIQGGELKVKTAVAGLHVIPPSEVFFCSPDILHLHNAHVVPKDLTARIPSVATLHDAEDSVDRGEVRRWIVVRKELAALVSGAVHIPNGFDLSRFVPSPIPQSDSTVVLAAGNFRDKRRLPMLHDLIQQAEAGEIVLQLVGLGVNQIPPGKHIKVSPPVWGIERFISACHQTAGIYTGRITIEGFLCDRPGWVYNEHGSKTLMAPPPDVRERFDIRTVAQQIMGIYGEVAE